MYRHGRIYDGADVLDVGTGCGYGAALLTRRLGARHVTSIDVDPYLTSTATQRLGSFGAHPVILTIDAAGELPGDYDRIVPMVSMPAIPSSWLAALRPRGRLVFSLTGGSVIITADKQPDGSAAGQVERYHAGFMTARHGPDYPSRPMGLPEHVRRGDGDDITVSPYPIVDPTWGWELDAMLSVVAPGISYYHDTDTKTGTTTAWMTHEDGSWARATGTGDEAAVVHQAGPRRLWDILDGIRHDWLTHGALPLRGAAARIEPDGTCHLSQGQWHATIPGVRHDHLQGHIAVLAVRWRLSLAPQHRQARGDRRPRVDRINHVVHQAEFGGVVGVYELLHVLADQLGSQPRGVRGRR
jgi:SAM-dependent methyltransferase